MLLLTQLVCLLVKVLGSWLETGLYLCFCVRNLLFKLHNIVVKCKNLRLQILHLVVNDAAYSCRLCTGRSHPFRCSNLRAFFKFFKTVAELLNLLPNLVLLFLKIIDLQDQFDIVFQNSCVLLVMVFASLPNLLLELLVGVFKVVSVDFMLFNAALFESIGFFVFAADPTLM